MYWLVISSMLGSASAAGFGFTVASYGGPHCSGADEGIVGRTYSPSQPCYSIPVNAESAYIKLVADSGSLDGAEGANVAFYPSTDCSGQVVASATTGCIDFTATGGNAQSYRLLENSQDNKRDVVRVRRQAVLDNPWTAQQTRAREQLNISINDATGSLAPHWDPYVAIEGGLGHGNVTVIDGETWKWQQIALGVTIGIPIEDWDDSIHVLKEDFVAYGDHDLPPSRSPGSSRACTGGVCKRWNYAQCQAALACTREILNGGALGIGAGWGQAVMAIDKLRNFGTTLYDFVHAHPISVTLVTTVAGPGIGYAYGHAKGSVATAQDNDQLSGCDEENTQVAAFIESFTDATTAGQHNAAEVVITLPNGHQLLLSGQVWPKGSSPPQVAYCGADS